MDLYNFLFFVALYIFFLFISSSNLCPAKHLYKNLQVTGTRKWSRSARIHLFTIAFGKRMEKNALLHPYKNSKTEYPMKAELAASLGEEKNLLGNREECNLKPIHYLKHVVMSMFKK